MKMPWGKYKDEELDDIPSDYLYWIAANCDQDNIASAADEEYRWREDNSAHFWEEKGSS